MPYLVLRRDAPRPTVTAVIAAVAAADQLVGEYRVRLDPAASWGVPAHVTVLYPFVAPDRLDDEVLATLTAVVRTVPAFDCAFERVGWFDDDVAWLDPTPAEPFRQLTAAVHTAFPAHPPYAGAHPDVVPHLTIGERRLAGLDALRAAARSVETGLRLMAHIDTLLLIAGTSAESSWRTLREIPLG